VPDLTCQERWHVFDDNHAWLQRLRDTRDGKHQQVTSVLRTGVRVVAKASIASSAAHALTRRARREQIKRFARERAFVSPHDLFPGLHKIAGHALSIRMIATRDFQAAIVYFRYHPKAESRAMETDVPRAAIREEANGV
jgi:hypothetical protein